MSSGPYSFETEDVKSLHPGDYAVFAVMMGLSAAIGIFYAIKDRRKNNTEEFLMGGRSMHPIPVAMSLLSSFISSVTVIGTPAESYSYNTMYWWVAVGFFFSALGSAHVYLPVFHQLRLTSVFTYLEMRFCKYTKLFCCFTHLLFMLLYMAVVLYTPSLALNAVTGLSLWGTIAAVCVVCVFYTSLGGLKAVLWADTIQMTIVFVGMLVLIIAGVEVQGGIKTVWEKADSMGKIVLDELNPDPRVRYSVWNTVVGGAMLWLTIYGINQASVQRAIAVDHVRKTKIAMWLNFPGFIFVISMAMLLGVVMASFYSGCDPITAKLVNRPDQIVPLFTLDILGQYHGVPGLFLAAVFSGSLSTISSGFNAIVTILLEDFIRPFSCKKMSASQATWLSRALVVFIGGVCVALAFMISELGSMVLQFIIALFGVFGGPLLGVFTLGMLFPWANRWGGLVGVISSTALLLWIGFGTILTKTSVTVKSPVSIEGCNWNMSKIATPLPATTTTTTIANVVSTDILDKYTGVQRIYSMSFQWYTGLGMLTVVVVGMIVSLITGLTDTTKLNPKLICPFFDTFFPCLPEKTRKWLRFGVPFNEDTDGHSEKVDLGNKMDTIISEKGKTSDWSNGGATKPGFVNEAYSPPLYEAQQTKL